MSSVETTPVCRSSMSGVKYSGTNFKFPRRDLGPLRDEFPIPIHRACLAHIILYLLKAGIMRTSCTCHSLRPAAATPARKILGCESQSRSCRWIMGAYIQYGSICIECLAANVFQSGIPMTTRDRVLCSARLQDVRLPYIPAQSAIPSAWNLFLNFSMLL